MSPSAAYKAYVKRLANSGLAAPKATLLMLSELPRTEAFQWFMTNRYKPVVEVAAAAMSDEDATSAFLKDVLDGDTDEDTEPEVTLASLEGDPQATLALLNAPEKRKARPSAKRRRSKTPKHTKQDSRWGSGLYKRYNITPQVGMTFTSKHGTPFVVTLVGDDHVRAARLA